jgi:hypothetical protein
MDDESKLLDEPARILSKLDQRPDDRFDMHQQHPSLEPVRTLTPAARPLGKLLYKDKAIIQQIYDCIVASRMYNRLPLSHVPPLKYIEEYFISTPSSARWLQLVPPDSQEQSNEFELEWNPAEDINFDHLALVLAMAVPVKKSVEELVNRTNDQRDEDIIYPGMPIRVHGLVMSGDDISSKEICLHGEEKSTVRVIFTCDHGLDWSPALFQERLVFVLGIIQSIGEDVITKSGVLLL